MLRTHYVDEIGADMDGMKVTIGGWAHEIRETSKITFLILRDSTGLAQVIGKAGEAKPEVIKKMSVPKESVLLVRGTIKANKESMGGFEIVPEEIENLNPLSARIPFEVTGKVPAEIDVRLNYRYIDLRRPQARAVFSIESTILNTFTQYLSGKGFTQIRTPCIISEASEGGAEVFEIKYFDRKAFLAQSPQLYKQLSVIGGLDRVMMVVPVMRAEKSNTAYHLTECTQMDIEMAFADADDVIEILEGTVLYTIKSVMEENADDLKSLGVKLELPQIRRVTYTEAVDRLAKHGHKIEHGDDFSKQHEGALQELYGDAVVVKDFPAKARAFYSMPKEGNEELTNSFDFIYKGFEICSGAQRIHDPEMLIKSLKKKGIDQKGFDFYINAFRCGAPPHAGWSIGLERFGMCICGLSNIREASLFPRDPKRINP